MNDPIPGPTRLETLFGGTELSVTKLSGETEKVKVLQLPIKIYPVYSQLLNDEIRSVELFCDKPVGWADLLTNESIEAVIIEGERLNADFFARWQARQKKRSDLLPKVNVEETSAMLDALATRNPELLDRILKSATTPSLSASPASPSAPTSPLKTPAAAPLRG